MMNGFECYFYPNQGLRFLTELKNGKQMDVTSWDKMVVMKGKFIS